ncbi:GNAT family N-acetyltransferase [Leeia oryzae]|uniref:GNAT family N-acetyltransferase n=1 Tax=Leeia oryzae TaxID=356662 RepID=UPI00035D6A4E|nr:GNAT family N-acetyltransferase [Leeia oryzae]
MQLQIHSDIRQIGASGWDFLAGEQPFLQHRFLDALALHGCVGPDTGWQTAHLSLTEGDELLAAMPLYLKSHSYGEYVFDWAWANACEQAGVPYYPKLLTAIPFTPVTGCRWLARSEMYREVMLDQVMAFAEEQQLSGWHVLFAEDAPVEAMRERGWLNRRGVQFHWLNRGYRDFGDFLDNLRSDKRKKLKQERRKVQETGVQICRKTGTDITPADWDFFYRCYAQTYREHRSSPYLTRDFFQTLGQTMPENCLLVMASQNDQPIAAALNLMDDQRLYGRYWGALAWVPGLHFELCYYQGIEFAIERGLQVFEGGAQGEHKLARGFEAVETQSWHWLRHAGLSAAVARYLAHEGKGIGHYLDELQERAPFAQG